MKMREKKEHEKKNNIIMVKVGQFTIFEERKNQRKIRVKLRKQM